MQSFHRSFGFLCFLPLSPFFNICAIDFVIFLVDFILFRLYIWVYMSVGLRDWHMESSSLLSLPSSRVGNEVCMV
jgi:hypothetical protein